MISPYRRDNSLAHWLVVLREGSRILDELIPVEKPPGRHLEIIDFAEKEALEP